jgi:hypothetical protein
MNDRMISFINVDIPGSNRALGGARNLWSVSFLIVVVVVNISAARRRAPQIFLGSELRYAHIRIITFVA